MLQMASGGGLISEQAVHGGWTKHLASQGLVATIGTTPVTETEVPVAPDTFASVAWYKECRIESLLSCGSEI
jgi:hypothetical protein